MMYRQSADVPMHVIYLDQQHRNYRIRLDASAATKEAENMQKRPNSIRNSCFIGTGTV